MKQSLGAVGLLVLTVLAGCGNAASGAPGETRTLTPAPVPTTAQPFPPGVSEAGVSKATLAAAHRDRLLATNHTVTVRQRVAGANGTLLRSVRRHRVAAGGEPTYGRYNLTAFRFTTPRPVDVAYWTGPEGGAMRLAGGVGEPAVYWSSDGTWTLDVNGSWQLGRAFETLSPRVADRRGDAVVLVATGATDLARLPGPSYVGDRRNVSATFEVGPDGLVTAWRVAYDARFDGRPVRVVTAVRVTDVGTTTVPRPEWVDAAKNSSGRDQ